MQVQGVKKCITDVPEVVMDILSKLPVKSLARFKCVCKPWRDSVGTFDFITKHHRNTCKNNHLKPLLKVRNINNPNELYFSVLSIKNDEKGENFVVEETIHSPFFQNTEELYVYGPCNGLVCLYSSRSQVGLCLWNPSTREFKTLPRPTLSVNLNRPLKRPRITSSTEFMFGSNGFGYDSVNDDYKIVRHVRFEIDNVIDWIVKVVLYSLKNDSWKEVSLDGRYATYEYRELRNNYVNGFYYWDAWRYDESQGKVILSFDMANENFSTLPRIPVISNEDEVDYNTYLVDFKGLLGGIVYPDEGIDEKSFELWVWNGSWEKQLTIENVPGVERPFGFWKNGELFCESSNLELMLFDPHSRELKNLGITAFEDSMNLVLYHESLVPINGRSELELQIVRRRMQNIVIEDEEGSQEKQ